MGLTPEQIKYLDSLKGKESSDFIESIDSASNAVGDAYNKSNKYIEKKSKEHSIVSTGLAGAGIAAGGYSLLRSVGSSVPYLPIAASLGAEAIDYTGIFKNQLGDMKLGPSISAGVNPVVSPFGFDYSLMDIPKDYSMILAPWRQQLAQNLAKQKALQLAKKAAAKSAEKTAEYWAKKAAEKSGDESVKSLAKKMAKATAERATKAAAETVTSAPNWFQKKGANFLKLAAGSEGGLLKNLPKAAKIPGVGAGIDAAQSIYYGIQGDTYSMKMKALEALMNAGTAVGDVALTASGVGAPASWALTAADVAAEIAIDHMIAQHRKQGSEGNLPKQMSVKPVPAPVPQEVKTPKSSNNLPKGATIKGDGTIDIPNDAVPIDPSTLPLGSQTVKDPKTEKFYRIENPSNKDLNTNTTAFYDPEKNAYSLKLPTLDDDKNQFKGFQPEKPTVEIQEEKKEIPTTTPPEAPQAPPIPQETTPTLPIPPQTPPVVVPPTPSASMPSILNIPNTPNMPVPVPSSVQQQTNQNNNGLHEAITTAIKDGFKDKGTSPGNVNIMGGSTSQQVTQYVGTMTTIERHRDRIRKKYSNTQ